jgi:Tol biopolymer transport system component
MSLPNLDGKYFSGKRRKNLFREERKARLPVALILLAVIVIAIFIFPVTTAPDTTFHEQVVFSSTLTLPPPTPTETPLPTPTSIHGGRIVFTCTRGDWNQICMVNADGTGYVQVTDNGKNNYYPTFTPDGKGIVFATNIADGFDLFAYIFSEAKTIQLTYYIGNAFSPKYSPDGQQILFLNRAKQGPTAIWIMGALGENPRALYAGPNTIVGADWSPDGKSIAFAMQASQTTGYEIYLLNAEDPAQYPTRITKAIEGVTGSIDWSRDGKSLLLCMGPAGDKNVFRLDIATGQAFQLTFGGNNASASYSLDGLYIVYNSLRNDGQADLFVIHANGGGERMLVDNPEPDWQPQWGP